MGTYLKAGGETSEIAVELPNDLEWSHTYQTYDVFVYLLGSDELTEVLEYSCGD